MESVGSTLNGNEMNQTAQAQDMGLSFNAMSGLAYFSSIAAIVALVADPYKKDAKVRFNAIQSLLASATFGVAYMILAIGTAIASLVISGLLGALKLYALMGILLGVFPIMNMVFGLAGLALWVYLIVAGANGKTPQLPVLAFYAKKFAKT